MEVNKTKGIRLARDLVVTLIAFLGPTSGLIAKYKWELFNWFGFFLPFVISLAALALFLWGGGWRTKWRAWVFGVCLLLGLVYPVFMTFFFRLDLGDF